MRTIGMLVGLLSIACFAWACDGQPMCGGDDLGNGQTNCDLDPGEGGSGGSATDQFVDQQGICRSTRDFESLGCPATFDLALAAPLRCGPVCAGTCGDWLVLQDSCTPSLGCSYDPLSRALVGVVWGDDVPNHCGERSYDVTYGDGYNRCQFSNLIVSNGCSP